MDGVACGPRGRLQYLVAPKALEEAVAGEHCLRLERRRGDDDRPRVVHDAREGEHQELRQHLVLAGLAGEDDRVLVATARENA